MIIESHARHESVRDGQCLIVELGLAGLIPKAILLTDLCNICKLIPTIQVTLCECNQVHASVYSILG